MNPDTKPEGPQPKPLTIEPKKNTNQRQRKEDICFLGYSST